MQQVVASLTRDEAFAQWDPLATHVAKKLWQRPWIRRLGTFKDVLQEARMGLLKAIDGFDTGKPGAASFMTYAHSCITRHVERKAQCAGVVRFPIQQQVDGFVPPPIRQLPDTFDQELPDTQVELSREDHELVLAVQAVIEDMRNPYRAVMVARWGLFGSEPKTYEEIANQIDSTPFLVRDIEQIATREVMIELRRRATPAADRVQTGDLFGSASSGRESGFWKRKQRRKKGEVAAAQPALF